jgi:hypothetical protein
VVSGDNPNAAFQPGREILDVLQTTPTEITYVIDQVFRAHLQIPGINVRNVHLVNVLKLPSIRHVGQNLGVAPMLVTGKPRIFFLEARGFLVS